MVSDSPGPKRHDENEEIDLPEGTSLRVYLYLLQQSKPVSLSEIRTGLNLSTSSLASYHVQRLLAASLVRQEPGGYVADKMALKGFLRVRKHLVSTGFFMVGFFAATLLLILLAPWHSHNQQVAMGALAIMVALAYSLSRTLQSMKWLHNRIRPKRDTPP